MKELLCTNNIVLISYVQDLLAQHSVTPQIFDENFSILDGSVGIIPRRIMVCDDEFDCARQLLIEVGLKDELTASNREELEGGGGFARKVHYGTQ